MRSFKTLTKTLTLVDANVGGSTTALRDHSRPTCVCRVFCGTREHPIIYSGNKATLVNILREQRNEPNFGEDGMWRFGKHFGDNKTFANSADSDQSAHQHEHG